MDAGAHFHCCDLRVRTPRDPDWSGGCPVTETERKTYATDFIAACRRKGLDAIAITDPHDLTFFPYIREAAATERDHNGQFVPPAGRVVVFPGMELTLGIPSKALLLFDPRVDEADLERAVGILGIESAPRENPKAINPIQSLPFDDLNLIYRKLSKYPSLRDRFVVLPNVDDGGPDTLLRPERLDQYKNMLCVGGYIDGTYSGHSRRNILDGKDADWGSKKIALIQTSGSRSRDFSQLGTHATWIKWSNPSTEALRQACLASESRLRYFAPMLPDNYISGISVTNSKYFGPFHLGFNSQLNAIIGGRGTGKSTLLEYVRWALCDQSYLHDEAERTELPDFEKRRRSVLSGTLRQWEGTVVVDYIRHGVLHRVRRDGITGKVYLKIAQQDECETTEGTIQNLAQIQGYSQRQLSHVSVRTQELMRLLKAPIAREVAAIEFQCDAAARDLRQVFDRCESRRRLLSQLQTIDLDLTSTRAQMRTLAELVGDLPEEQRAGENAHLSHVEAQCVGNKYSTAVHSAAEMIEAANLRLRNIAKGLPAGGSARSNVRLPPLHDKLDDTLRNAVDGLDAIGASLSRLNDQLNEFIHQVTEDIDSDRARYQAATAQNPTIRKRVESMCELTAEVIRLEMERIGLEQRLEEIGDADSELVSARARWRTAIEKEASLLDQQAVKLTADSNDDLRVRVESAINLEALKRALLDGFRGALITTPEKVEKLARAVSESSEPVALWVQLTEELIGLARTGPQIPIGAELPPTPILTASGFVPSELRLIGSRLTPADAFDLALRYPESVPKFEYKIVGETYIPFEEASPGQQATALISILLNQTAGPLLVDQPEDDLDASTILSLAGRLEVAKEKRQVIFTTHNPNLVVIGDADLVLHCACTQPGQTAKVHVANQGALDNPMICDVITTVMEGGGAAFRLRDMLR
jgi:chromosome segregation protein